MRILTLLGCLLLAFQSFAQQAVSQRAADSVAYVQSVIDAAVPLPKEVAPVLVALNRGNCNLCWRKINGEWYIKMITWKRAADTVFFVRKDSIYNTGSRDLWVTAAPELKERGAAFGLNRENNNAAVQLRLQQLLGLPTSANYEYFVEMWIRPQDVFRPCPDPETTDQACSLCFPDNVSDEHRRWISDYRADSYPRNKAAGYPWTQLGYTYDWNPGNPTHIGLSEFVVRRDVNIRIIRFVSTKNYLQEKEEKGKCECAK